MKSSFSKSESEVCAFFQNADDTYELVKTLVAFANSKGGTAVIGLKKNGKIIGVYPESELKNIHSIVASHTEPCVKFSFEIVEESFKMVLILRIEKSDDVKYKAIDSNGKGDMYFRKGAFNYKANKILEYVWKYKKLNGDKPATFTANELVLIDLLKDNPKISLTQIYKKSKLTIKQVDYILVRLVSWKVVQMEIIENGSLFSL